MKEQCETRGIGNFGQGTINVRCIYVGEHTEHYFAQDTSEDKEVKHKNVFEEGKIIK